VGDREILETYLNSETKNTPATNIFPQGTKTLLTSVIGDPDNQRSDKWSYTVYVHVHVCRFIGYTVRNSVWQQGAGGNVCT